jgi:hypothetical protein
MDFWVPLPSHHQQQSSSSTACTLWSVPLQFPNQVTLTSPPGPNLGAPHHLPSPKYDPLLGITVALGGARSTIMLTLVLDAVTY